MAIRRKLDGLDTFLTRRNDLVSLADAIVRNRAVAEELVQDSWIQWSNKDYPDNSAEPIFKRIVLNLARDWLRKQKREWARFEAFALFYDNAPDTERVVIAREDLLNVFMALQSLSERSLRAFRLSRVEGLTYPQIAERMGIATSTAYTLVADALVKVTLASQE